jgi:hypothetical protein
MKLESVRIRKDYVDMLRELKDETRVPISANIEAAIKDMFGEPKSKKKKK